MLRDRRHSRHHSHDGTPPETMAKVAAADQEARLPNTSDLVAPEDAGDQEHSSRSRLTGRPDTVAPTQRPCSDTNTKGIWLRVVRLYGQRRIRP
jgi:hypothetical protein